MRKIKFRAWDTLNKEMHDWDQIRGHWDIDALLGGLWEDFGGKKHPWNYPIPMQYTGLKDKNGVEIFEGDIVQLIDSEQINQRDENGAYVDAFFEEIDEIDSVEFDEGRFKLRNTEFDVGICRTVEDFQVIGNIYENPELLKLP